MSDKLFACAGGLLGLGALLGVLGYFIGKTIGA